MCIRHELVILRFIVLRKRAYIMTINDDFTFCSINIWMGKLTRDMC